MANFSITDDRIFPLEWQRRMRIRFFFSIQPSTARTYDDWTDGCVKRGASVPKNEIREAQSTSERSFSFEKPKCGAYT